jgi:cell division septal protein FtsQ
MLAGKNNYHKKYRIKKDYQAKNLKNPFFRTEKNIKKTKKNKFVYYAIALFLLIGLFSYIIFFSPLFLLKTIKINGLGRLPETAISEYLWQQTNQKSFWPLTQKNLILFDREDAEKSLMNNFNFSKIKINKIFFHSLSVDIEERPYAFIWQEKNQQGSDQYYYSDSKGFIIKDSAVNPDDLNKFPVIENQTPESLIQEDYLKLDQEYLVFIFSLNSLAEKSPDTKIKRFLISQELNTVKVIFDNDLLAYFRTKDDVNKQLDKFLVVKKEKIKDNLSNINYVDLRYGDKVYIGNK